MTGKGMDKLCPEIPLPNIPLPFLNSSFLCRGITTASIGRASPHSEFLTCRPTAYWLQDSEALYAVVTHKRSVKSSITTIVRLLPLFLGACAAVAQAPTGQFTNSMTLVPLWDFSGSYDLSNEWNTVSLDLVHQANGKITGVRTETFSLPPAINFEGSASDNGRVTSTARGVGFVTSWKETALATAAAGSYEVTKMAHGKWTVVPGLLALQNEGTCRTCVGRHCDTKTAVYQVSLPAGMTGTWNLQLTLQAQGNKLSGNAVLALSNGRTLNYTLSGRYNAKTQVSTLHFIGTGETRGTSMVTTFAGPQLQLKSLTGSVLGQRLKYP
jgi:hypothetical protein